MLAFFIKSSQHFISELEIYYILGWNTYRLLNYVVDRYFTLFSNKKNTFITQNYYENYLL